MELELVRAPHWSKFKYYWRRRPDYSSNTPARAANRLRFARAAVSTRGEGYSEGEMKPACLAVMETAKEPVVEEYSMVAPLSDSILRRLERNKIDKKEREGGVSPAPIIVFY